MAALIAFYSRAGENYFSGTHRAIAVGNTEKAARLLAELTGAELFHIEQKAPYSDNYDACVAEARRDLRANARPELMALPLAEATGVPLYENALCRARKKKHQAGLPFYERVANVAGAFRVTDPELVERRNIILVDDVLTTGTTAAACAQALLADGAASVFVVTLATVEKDLAPLDAWKEDEQFPDI